MGWRLLAGAAATVHFAFIAYVIFGGVLAWRRPRAVYVHAFAVAWALAGIVVVMPCPLTDVEDGLRARAGVDALDRQGFIDHYLTGTLYPDSAVGLVQALVLTAVAVSWLVAAILWRRRRRVAVDHVSR